jgi:hypothetical protein
MKNSRKETPMKTQTRSLFAIAVIILFSENSCAALFDRGGGLIYDSNLDVTWLQDMNYASTEWVQSNGLKGTRDGLMMWDQAIQWASDLEYYDSVRGKTLKDWVLPTVTPSVYQQANSGTDLGFNVITQNSQIASLWYQTLRNTALYDKNGNYQGVINRSDGPFINMNKAPYWLGTDYAPNRNYAWIFDTYSGNQFYGTNKYSGMPAMVLMLGDVAAVPEPDALLLAASGIGVLAYRRRAKHKNELRHKI